MEDNNLPLNDKELFEELFIEKKNIPEIIEILKKEIRKIFASSPEVVEKIMEEVEYIVRFSDSNYSILKLVLDVLKDYKDYHPEIAKTIVWKIRDITIFTEDEKLVKFVAKMYRDKDVKETIKSYLDHPEIAKTIIGRIGDIAMSTEDEKLVKFVAKMYRDKDVKETIKSYLDHPEIAKTIIGRIGDIAMSTENKRIIKYAAKILKSYTEDYPETVRSIAWRVGDLAKTTENEKIIKLVLDVLKDYKDYHPGVAKTIVDKILYIAEFSRDEKLVKFVAKMYRDKDVKETIKSYLDHPEIAIQIAWMIGNVAMSSQNKRAVKNFADLVKDKEIGRYIIIFTSDILSKISTKYYKLVKSEGIEGIKKVEIGEILGINPKVEDFWNKAKKVIEEKYGIDLSSLSTNELKYTVEGLKKLFDENVLSLKKLLELLIENKYWEDKEIKKVINEMKKYGINVEKLRGEFWVNKLDGKEEILEYRFEQAVNDLVICTLGSRDPKKFEESYKRLSEYVGKEKVDSLRGFLNGKLKNEILKLYREQKFDEIVKFYEDFTNQMEEKGKRKENVLDTIQAVKALKRGRMKGEYIIGFYGKYLPMLYSNESTMCCAMLPGGMNKYASVLYLLDPRVLLIGYVISDEYEKGKELEIVRERGEMDGVVIGYIGLYENKPALIVDSVEGGREFREFAVNNYQRVMNDIHRVAKDLGINYVIYNVNTTNETPREFLEKIKGDVEEYKTEIIDNPKIPYDYTKDAKHYLEAYGGWEIPKGVVKGIKYEIS